MQEKSQIEKIHRDVQIPIAEHMSIGADLVIPAGARAIVAQTVAGPDVDDIRLSILQKGLQKKQKLLLFKV